MLQINIDDYQPFKEQKDIVSDNSKEVRIFGGFGSGVTYSALLNILQNNKGQTVIYMLPARIDACYIFGRIPKSGYYDILGTKIYPSSLKCNDHEDIIKKADAIWFDNIHFIYDKYHQKMRALVNNHKVIWSGLPVKYGKQYDDFANTRYHRLSTLDNPYIDASGITDAVNIKNASQHIYGYYDMPEANYYKNQIMIYL